MIVIVRAGGTHLVNEAVYGEQQAVAGGEQQKAHRPANLDRQFRHEAEQRHTQEYARTEGDHHPGTLAQASEPKAKCGAAQPDRGGQRRSGDACGRR